VLMNVSHEPACMCQKRSIAAGLCTSCCLVIKVAKPTDCSRPFWLVPESAVGLTETKLNKHLHVTAAEMANPAGTARAHGEGAPSSSSQVQA
jgi:hypothetical protein